MSYIDKIKENKEWLYWIAIIGLFLFLYQPTLKWMYNRYTAPDTYYSHGFIVPIIIGFLIWQKRDELKKIPITYSWWGFILVIVALIIHMASAVFYVFFSSGISIIFLAFGFVLFIYGNKLVKELSFPLIFTIFMIPVPITLINKLSVPMKMGVAVASSKLINSIGIPLNQTGFYIQVPRGTLLIDNPCSGIRSLIAFLALGSLLAYISRLSINKKIVIFMTAIPIAFFTNILRVAFLILVTYFYGNQAASPDSWAHDLSGYATFIIGATILFGLGKVLEWK